MSSRKKAPVLRSRKAQPDPYTSRIMKPPSKRELEAHLNHAVRNHDYDALEDYDEEQVRPPTGAVAPLKEESLADLLGDDEQGDPFDPLDFDWHADYDMRDDYDDWWDEG